MGRVARGHRASGLGRRGRVAAIPYTTSGLLHDRGSQVLALALLLAALASVRLIDERGFRLWVLACAGLLVAVPSALVAAGYDAPGWGQRGIIAVGLLWQWRLLAAASLAARPWPRR